MFKKNNKTDSIVDSYLLQIQKYSSEVKSLSPAPEKVVISAPHYFWALIYKQITRDSKIDYQEFISKQLFGCEIQEGYESAIVVYNKWHNHDKSLIARIELK